MSTKTAAPHVGQDARQHAQRKAAYGRRDWLVWTNNQGQRCCAPLTRPAVKEALLAHGTRIKEGELLLVHKGCGSTQYLNWNDAIRIWNNLRWFS